METKILWAIATAAPFVPAARLEAVELVSQIGSLGTGRGVGCLDQGGFQVDIAFGDTGTLALAR